MGLFSKDINSMDELCVHVLQDVYYAENQIVKSLPKMIENATDGELKRGLQSHLKETEKQVQRLEQVFGMLEQEPKGTRCPALDGIVEEAESIMGETGDQKVRDAAIIASGQAVEHYEITRYGSLIQWLRELGRSDCARVLTQTLNEEKAADKKLTAIAEKRVNPRAEGRAAKGRRAGPASPRRSATRGRSGRSGTGARSPAKRSKKGGRSSSKRSA